MDHPIRVAFCLLLFKENGGKQDALGLPIFSSAVRSRCNRPYDCADCPTMQRSLEAVRPPEYYAWECYDCIKRTGDVPRKLPGYYSSGVCPRCEFETSFLQLVLRTGV